MALRRETGSLMVEDKAESGLPWTVRTGLGAGGVDGGRAGLGRPVVMMMIAGWASRLGVVEEHGLLEKTSSRLSLTLIWPDRCRCIYCSSAGIYHKSDQLPHFEINAVDPKSRHKGKLETESLLESRGVNWTSIRLICIYGPLNYNHVED